MLFLKIQGINSYLLLPTERLKGYLNFTSSSGNSGKRSCCSSSAWIELCSMGRPPVVAIFSSDYTGRWRKRCASHAIGGIERGHFFIHTVKVFQCASGAWGFSEKERTEPSKGSWLSRVGTGRLCGKKRSPALQTRSSAVSVSYMTTLTRKIEKQSLRYFFPSREKEHSLLKWGVWQLLSVLPACH